MTTSDDALTTAGINPVTLKIIGTRLAPFATSLLYVALFLMFILINGERFYSSTNLTNVLGQSAILGITAVGLTVAFSVSQFDLSVGWLASLTGVIASSVAIDYGTVAGYTAAIATGVVVGLVNGFVVTRLRVISFVATLGMGAILIGITKWINSRLVFGVPEDFSSVSRTKLLAVPLTAWIMVLLAVLLWVLMTQTPVGRHMYAVGGNRDAARLAGLNVDRMAWLALVVSASCAGLAGVLLAANLGAGQLGAGDGLLINAFTASAIGMVTFRRGEFNVAGTVVAVLLLQTLLNGMTMAGWSTFYQDLLKGIILIGAVGISASSQRLSLL